MTEYLPLWEHLNLIIVTSSNLQPVNIQEVTVRTREILDSIDKEVAEAQNKRKLEELQRNLDTSGLEKLGQENQVFIDYRCRIITYYIIFYSYLI